MNELKPLEGDFSVTLKMKSDWHIGSGVGRPGDIDALARRDEDDLPYVPAKTLIGIWRDACETVARGLDNDTESGVWHQWVAYLFGEQPALTEREPEDEAEKQARREKLAQLNKPLPSRLSVRSAHLPKDLRKAIKAKPRLREAVTFVKPGIKIHQRTGQTITDFLRFEEMARIDAELKAKCSLNLPQSLSPEQKQAASTLLVIGAAFVERMGGNRRRGAGKCELTIDEIDKNQWIRWLAEQVKKKAEFASPPKQEGDSSNSPDDLLTQPSAEGKWISIPLRIETKTRVMVPNRVIGNVVQTLSHIPGTYLLPFVTRKLGDDVRAAIARGDLLVTNATPIIKRTRKSDDGKLKEDELPTRPVPANLAYKKLGGGFKEGHDVYNLLEDEKPADQLKDYRAGYVCAFDRDALPSYTTTKLAVETHNVVEDGKQRPTSDVGGVFSYLAIAQGEVFHAELRLRHSLTAKLPKDWQKLLLGSYCIGRARKDDYGLVEISRIEQLEEMNVLAGEMQTSDEQSSKPKELRVWLLSDLLLRDWRLRPTASIDHFAVVLGRELGRKPSETPSKEPKVKLKLRKQIEPDCKDNKPALMNFAARQQRTDSWHTQWGLPRPTLAGLAAGSCFVFEIEGMKCDLETFENNLKNIAAAGLGERRAEGYGQMCFDDPLLSDEIKDKNSSERTENKEKPLEEIASGDYARLIETEGWRKEIRRRAMALANSKKWREEKLGFTFTYNDGQPSSKPKMSQLGGLRSVVFQLRNEHRDQNDNVVGKWANAIKKAEEKWPKESLGKIKTLCRAGQQVWALLDKQANENDDQPPLDWPTEWSDLTITADSEAVLKRELWAEAVRTLVDACIRAHKRQLEEMQDKAGKAAGGEEK